MDQRGPATAVVVDEWPLVRVGIVQTLRSIGIEVLADVSQGEEAVRLLQVGAAGYLLLGTSRDLPLAEVARRARALPSAPSILVLVDQISREEMGALRAVGIDALLQRSVGTAELIDAMARVARGERVVTPALLSLLVGFLAHPEPGEAAADGARRGSGPGHGALTRKELEVLVRLSEGRSNREIAEALYITPATVKSHLAHIYVKLGVAGRQEAMARAVALGLLG